MLEAASEEVALDSVLGEQERLLVGRSRLGDAAQATQEVGACGGSVAVARELRFGGEGVERCESGFGTIGEADGDGAVERHHR